MKRSAAERVIERMPETSQQSEAYAAERLDIENTIVERMRTMDTDAYENLLRPAFKDDEWVVVARRRDARLPVRRVPGPDHHELRRLMYHAAERRDGQRDRAACTQFVTVRGPWWSTGCRLGGMAASRRFSFRAEADLVERHDRALVELERLRRERPERAESVCHDFDARLAAAQERGLSSSAARLRATLSALVGAVEQALADEQLDQSERSASDDEAQAASQAAADAMVTPI